MSDPAPVDIVDRHSPVVVEVNSDTCDAYPATARVPAFVCAELPSGRPLAFCAHQGTHHRAALTTAGAVIVDLSHLVGA